MFLARAGIASRRACEQLIEQGRVAVNGRIIREMGVRVGETDRVEFDGKPVVLLREKKYYALNKPIRVLCTQHDERGRKKAIDFFPQKAAKGLFHVGRLDFMSSGLIFFTTDGEFARRVTHPSSGVEKEYLLETVTEIPPAMLDDYRRGVRIEGELFRLASFRIESKKRVRLILRQGKNREIRRVCGAYGVTVRSLERVRIGCVGISGIASGCYRDLTQKEIAWFLQADR